jgi:arylsulfatase A-like enzyme
MLEQDQTIAETMTHRDLKLRHPPQFLDALTDEQRTAWLAMFAHRGAEYDAVKEDPVALKKWKSQTYMKDYMACVAAVDDAIGRLLEFLEEEGLAENTFIMYSSDQGFYIGEHGMFDKRFMYNESFKTPLIVRWPGHIPNPGSVNHAIVSNLDFPSTFLDVAGVEVPTDMQGRSFVPLLRGKTPADWRTSFYYHYYEYPSVHMVKRHYGVYDGRFKLIHFYDDIDHWELIDTIEDPNEMVNVYGQPRYATEQARLKTELARLKVELQVPPIVVNTRSYIFDEEMGATRPNMRGLFERVRGNIEQRQAVLRERGRE